MPTVPVHQGCAAAQAITSTASVEFLLGVFVLHQPFGIAVAAHVDADRRIAVAGEPRMGQLVAGNRAVALAVGQVLEDRRHRARRGVGRHPDARRQPAAVGHDDADVGCSTIWRGKEVTVFIAASDYAPRDVASPDCDMAGQSAMIPILVET